MSTLRAESNACEYVESVIELVVCLSCREMDSTFMPRLVMSKEIAKLLNASGIRGVFVTDRFLSAREVADGSVCHPGGVAPLAGRRPVRAFRLG